MLTPGWTHDIKGNGNLLLVYNSYLATNCFKDPLFREMIVFVEIYFPQKALLIETTTIYLQVLWDCKFSILVGQKYICTL